MDEQSEYYDATENPTQKDKRTAAEQDDEDSGVDNVSQILRESSVSVMCKLNEHFLFFVERGHIFNIFYENPNKIFGAQYL